MVRVRVRVRVIIVCGVILVSVIFYGTAPERNGLHSHKNDYLPRKSRTKNIPKKYVQNAHFFQKKIGGGLKTGIGA